MSNFKNMLIVVDPRLLEEVVSELFQKFRHNFGIQIQFESREVTRQWGFRVNVILFDDCEKHSC